MTFLTDKKCKEKLMYNSLSVIGKNLRKSEIIAELITSNFRIFLDMAVLETQYNDDIKLFMERILIKSNMEQVFIFKYFLSYF